MIMNDYVTAEEYIAIRDFLVKMREEKRKQQAIVDQERQIDAAIEAAIYAVGLEETKRIVRKVARDLRSKTNDVCEKIPF